MKRCMYDEFVVLASDGLWAVLDNQVAKFSKISQSDDGSRMSVSWFPSVLPVLKIEH